MPRDVSLRLSDMIEAITRLQILLDGVELEAFKVDWQKQWLVERGVEIISEASRHLPEDLKQRHPQIPWRNVAGIGNVLRHNYEHVEATILWVLVHDELPLLEKVCRNELAKVSKD